MQKIFQCLSKCWALHFQKVQKLDYQFLTWKISTDQLNNDKGNKKDAAASCSLFSEIVNRRLFHGQRLSFSVLVIFFRVTPEKKSELIFPNSLLILY